MMKNFFSGAAKDGEYDDASKDVYKKSGLQRVSSDDVNRAVIMPNGGGATEDDRDTAPGNIADELNNTSCFICPDMSLPVDDGIPLPENMDLFRKDDGNGQNFDVNKIIDSDSVSLVDEDLLLNTSAALDTRRRRKKRA